MITTEEARQNIKNSLTILRDKLQDSARVQEINFLLKRL